MTDFEIIGMLKSYVKNSLKGMGALKGAPCQILSITKVGDVNVVTFKWQDNEGVEHTSTMEVADGEAGSEVAVTPILSSGTKIAEIDVDGNTQSIFAPSGGGGGSTVVVTPTLSSGTKIAEIEVDGTTTNLFAPSGGGGGASALSELSDIDLSTLSDGDVLVYDNTSGKWVNESPEEGVLVDAVLSKSVMPTASVDYNGIPVLYIGSTSVSYTKGHTYVCEASGGAYSWADVTPSGGTPQVTQFEVTTSGWTADTTSQSGSTLYKKAIALTQVDTEFPTVNIGSTGSLPTKVQQTAYDLLQYVTVDSTVPCLYLYASAIPTDAFYIKVEGVA